MLLLITLILSEWPEKSRLFDENVGIFDDSMNLVKNRQKQDAASVENGESYIFQDGTLDFFGEKVYALAMTTIAQTFTRGGLANDAPDD